MGFKFQVGTTFTFATDIQVLDENDAVVDISGWTLTAGVMLNGCHNRIDIPATLIGGPPPTSGMFELADTFDWVLGPAVFSYRLTAPTGDSVSSTGARFEVTPNVGGPET